MTFLPVKCSGKNASFATLAISSLIAFPATTLADTVSTSEWNISADRIIRYDEPNSIVAEGNIVLEKRIKVPAQVETAAIKETGWSELLGESAQQETIPAAEIEEQTEAEDQQKTALMIQADWLTYDVDLQSIKARGNVKLIREEDTLVADQGKVDLNTETGSFTNAVIIRKENQLHLEGKNIEKTGINTYHIQEGWVITCEVNEGETPPWSFSSSDTRIEEDGYAVLKNAIFNIKGIPVFYSPYMVIPVKNTRQTGFVFPEIAHSSTGGFSTNVPFFVNLSDSMDVTLFPEIYEKRGFMPGAEFRYVRSEEVKGTIMGSYLDDSLSGDDQTTEYYTDTSYTHTNSDRYWIRGKADHVFGNEWLARLDLDIVSDLDYLTEFNSGYTGYKDTDARFQENFGRSFENKTDDTRDNTLKFLKSWSGMSLEIDMLAVNDVRSDEDKEDDDDPLWTLPEVQFSGVLPVGETSASFEWNTNYVNYYREDGIGGQRVDIHPNISTSVPLSQYLESRAELGVRDTYYVVQEYGDGEWDEDDTQNRLLADFEFEIATTLLRNFDLSGEKYTGFDHQLHPYVRYNYIPEVDQDDLPQFDSVDDISEENEITYGVDNFFNVFSNEDGASEYGWVKISQSYYLTDSYSDDPFSDVSLRLGFSPVKNLSLEYETDISVYGEGFTTHSLEGQYTNSRGDYFNLDYSFSESSDIDQINALIRAQLFAQWSTEFEIEHSIAESETNEANISLLYTALCWSVELQTKYTPDDTSYMVIFSLANIGTPLGLNL